MIHMRLCKVKNTKRCGHSNGGLHSGVEGTLNNPPGGFTLAPNVRNIVNEPTGKPPVFHSLPRSLEVPWIAPDMQQIMAKRGTFSQ